MFLLFDNLMKPVINLNISSYVQQHDNTETPLAQTVNCLLDKTWKHSS